MKKLIYLIAAIAILGLIVSGCIPVVPPTEQGDLSTLTKTVPPVWVDDDYCDGCPNDGHTWGTDAFATIQDGVDAVAVSGTVNVANGTYTEQVLIHKSISLVGQSEAGTILDGSTLGLSVGIEINADNVEVQNLTIKNYSSVGLIPQHYLGGWPPVFRQMDNIKLQDVTVKDCLYGYYPTKVTNLIIDDCDSIDNTADGIFAMECPGIQITNCNITNSGDHGMWVGTFAYWSMGPSDNALISNNKIDGAREGGISFVGSDGATISGNTITNVAGEGWSVGALSLKDGPSNVEAFNNTIYGNDGNWSGYNGTGHGIGIDGTPSNIYLNYNKIYDNAGYGIYNYSGITIDATHNWWGDKSGPNHSTLNTTGIGDKVSDNVKFCPWALDNAFTTFITLILSPFPQPEGSDVCLEATMNNSTSGIEVDFLFDDSDVGSATTNESGVATLCIESQSSGVYTVKAFVSTLPDCLKADALLAVYDPTEGFVTGGGWIYSEAGAYVPDTSAEGKATFGFVSKYKKGAAVPTGNTEFQFKAGDLNFHSDSYDWLVITGGQKAMYKGTGTINGAGNYGFMLSATDSNPDLFRIKIQDKDTDTVIYDNQFGDDDNAEPATEIAGGQIVIHKGK